jgi:hypothetical protein
MKAFSRTGARALAVICLLIASFTRGSKGSSAALQRPSKILLAVEVHDPEGNTLLPVRFPAREGVAHPVAKLAHQFPAFPYLNSFATLCDGLRRKPTTLASLVELYAAAQQVELCLPESFAATIQHVI